LVSTSPARTTLPWRRQLSTLLRGAGRGSPSRFERASASLRTVARAASCDSGKAGAASVGTERRLPYPAHRRLQREVRPLSRPIRAPPRFVRRSLLQFQHSKAVPHRRRCSADRSDSYANSASGSKRAGAMPWFPRRKELFQHKSQQRLGSCRAYQSVLAYMGMVPRLRRRGTQSGTANERR
jgi:hypothetical protein